ncbi:MAG: dockerin type I domain-containing protein, partial [Phycisphaerae bacterium]
PSEPPANDCDGNGVEDADDITNGTALDCNGNGAPDSCDIAGGASQDCDADGIPDDCAADTDGDGIIDSCDGCPNDPAKLDPGTCGCGAVDTIDTDGDGVVDCLDNCPNMPNPGQEDADMDGMGDACDTEACCIDGMTCSDRTATDCKAMGGTPQGPGSDCATAICARVDSARDWVYENLSGVTNCSADFTAILGTDPLPNDSYSYHWTITPPSDRPAGLFVEIMGGNTVHASFKPPERPAFSPGDLPYIVTVTITGNDEGNVGKAVFPITVRALGDVNGDRCVASADSAIITQVEDGLESNPDLMLAADVNCDGSADGFDRQIVDTFLNEGVCP